MNNARTYERDLEFRFRSILNTYSKAIVNLNNAYDMSYLRSLADGVMLLKLEASAWKTANDVIERIKQKKEV